MADTNKDATTNQKEQTQKVVVTVNRQGWSGFGSAGMYWPNGDTEADVNDKQLKQLLADQEAHWLSVRPASGGSFRSQTKKSE